MRQPSEVTQQGNNLLVPSLAAPSLNTFRVAQGGKGVAVPGCPACQKRIHTMAKFVDHLADDVLPALLERAGIR